jgi:predicted nucleic-acid-binding Zn-ribbon protein
LREKKMIHVFNKCLKCNSEKYELKTIAFPTKATGEVKFSMDIYYLKVCSECGFTEMYSAKVFEKNEKPAVEF